MDQTITLVVGSPFTTILGSVAFDHVVKLTPPARLSSLWQPELLHLTLKTGKICFEKLTFVAGIGILSISSIVCVSSHDVNNNKLMIEKKERIM